MSSRWPRRSRRSSRSASRSSSVRPSRSAASAAARSEEHTSELQSRPHLVCRLLLEKKKKLSSYCSTGLVDVGGFLALVVRDVLDDEEGHSPGPQLELDEDQDAGLQQFVLLGGLDDA